MAGLNFEEQVTDVQALITGKNPYPDMPLRVVDTPDGHYGAFILSYEPKSPTPGAIVRGTYHTAVTEMYYVLDGTGSMILGGELEDAKENDPSGYPVKSVAGPTAGGVIKNFTVVGFTPAPWLLCQQEYRARKQRTLSSHSEFLDRSQKLQV